MRRERGEVSRGQIIQIAIIGVAIVLAGIFFYRNLTSKGMDETQGEHWLCNNCGHVFYVKPSDLDDMLKSGKVMTGIDGLYCLKCPECKEYAAYRAYECPKCHKYYNLTQKTNGRAICPHCGYDPEAEAAEQLRKQKEGGGG
jgi:ssDNA-binding Zn-finger/Zn-ribbon topoisomerase 1